MAHELNNPASAAQRSSGQMKEMFRRLQILNVQLGGLNLEQEQLEKVKELDELAQERARQPVNLDALTRSDREAEFEQWLEKQGVEKAWELSPALVDLGYQETELSTLKDYFTQDQFPVVTDWLSSTHTVYSLLSEISLGTNRISEIVKALKTYTYMDKAPVQNVDVHEGLDNTLIILHNKLKKGITVQRQYEKKMPTIQANGGELNQVWTNIIDNAIDAMAGKGTLVLRTRMEDEWVVVEVEDDGPGIPKAIQAKIFDPFFTTKATGEGTGLGLNISRNLVVQKHHGLISVSSEPGKTCFTVRLPTKDSPAGK
jgi:signal transduction histidine kinase